jgi:IclR family transcriptional regulator, pca regulon regulatory protein
LYCDKGYRTAIALMKTRNFVESLSRGLSILSLLAETSLPLTLTELSQRLGLSLGAIQRLTYTLQELGYIERDATNKTFRLGPKTLSMDFRATRDLDLEKLAYPYLEEASREIGETVNLAIVDGKEIVYVGRHVSRRTLSVSIQIGSRRPLHCTSMGKVILAFMPEEQRGKVLGSLKLTSFTTRTMTRIRDLRRCLEMVRLQGFAISNEEMEVGVRSVAAPIRNSTGGVFSAVNIAVPTIRVSLKRLETELAGKVMEISEKISLLLGYHGDRGGAHGYYGNGVAEEGRG